MVALSAGLRSRFATMTTARALWGLGFGVWGLGFRV